MKKLRIVFAFCAGVVLMLSLAACGSKQAAQGYELSALQTLVEAGTFSEELEELDGDIAFALYHLEDGGLTQEDLSGSAVLRSAGATCEEGAVLVFTSEQAAQTAKEALQGYLDSQIESNRDYRPGEIPKLENALLEQSGSSVLMVVASDLEAAKTALGMK